MRVGAYRFYVINVAGLHKPVWGHHSKGRFYLGNKLLYWTKKSTKNRNTA